MPVNVKITSQVFVAIWRIDYANNLLFRRIKLSKELLDKDVREEIKITGSDREGPDYPDSSDVNISSEVQRQIDGSAVDKGYPLLAAPEQTGLTPEEEAYVPRTESKPLPRWLFGALFLFIVAAFGGGGAWYYRFNILPEKLFQEASNDFETGEYAHALHKYEKVLKLKPERKDTLLGIAYTLEKLGKNEEAISAYTKHLELQPRDTNAMIRLGSVCLGMGKYEAALNPFVMASKRDPKNGEIYYALGIIYDNLGSQKRASENYAKVIDSDTKDPEILFSASKALMKGGFYREALKGFNRAGGLVASDDSRAEHAIRAAKSMMGWPTDPALIITPGESLGELKIGMDASKLTSLYGAPSKRENDGKYELLSYGDNPENPKLTLWLEDGHVVQIESRLEKYKTAEGLSIGNFLNTKYSSEFDRWADSDTANQGFRYIIKGGGAAFYSSAESRAVIIYKGELPIGDTDISFWQKME